MQGVNPGPRLRSVASQKQRARWNRRCPAASTNVRILTVEAAFLRLQPNALVARLVLRDSGSLSVMLTRRCCNRSTHNKQYLLTSLLVHSYCTTHGRRRKLKRADAPAHPMLSLASYVRILFFMRLCSAGGTVQSLRPTRPVTQGRSKVFTAENTGVPVCSFGTMMASGIGKRSLRVGVLRTPSLCSAEFGVFCSPEMPAYQARCLCASVVFVVVL